MIDPQIHEEELIDELRKRLVVREELPPGLIQRVDITLLQEANRLQSVTWKEILVLGCVLFIVVGSVLPFLLTPPVIITALGASFTYVGGIRRLTILQLSFPTRAYAPKR